MDKLKLDDFLQYSFLSGLKYSLDGNKLALIVKKAKKAKGTGEIGEDGYHSVIYADSGGGFKRLTNANGDVSHFIWQDDETILFSEIRCPEIKKQVEKGLRRTSYYKININGGEAEHAFTVNLAVSSIKQLNGGEYLVNALYDINRPDFDAMDGAKLEATLAEYGKQKDYEVLDELPFWFNGQGYVNKIRNRLYIFNTETGLRPVTPENAAISDFIVSPCGRFAAFSGNIEQTGVRELKEHLHIIDLKKNETRTVTAERAFIADFAFWKDDIVLAYSNGEKYYMHEHPKFAVLDTKTMETRKLLDYDRSIKSCVNSDCRLGGGTMSKVVGDSYYVLSVDGVYSDVLKIDLVSGHIEKVTSNNGGVDMFDITEQNFAAVGFFDGRLQEVYTFENRDRTLISDFNGGIYRTKRYSKPVYHSFTDPDGYEIDGYALLPVDYDPEKKYPAILNIHGGPKTAFGDIYFHEMQYWASENYFVIYCNPRGSDGKGNDFAEIRGKYGTVDYSNLMRFTDEMIKKYPAVDPGRMGVTGGSYGGFMTNWIIGHTNRYKAAVSQRGISNWISFSYTSDIGYYFGNDQMQANIWEDVDKMWWHSPLKYADKVTTPTLFIHSWEDYRCWMPEAIQMFTALKTFGVETRLCTFYKENHELSRSGGPGHRIRRLREITGWMDKHLK